LGRPIAVKIATVRNKAIECEVISSFQIARSWGFKGDFRVWEHLLRILRMKKQIAKVQEPSQSWL
jgi:hypothetical protein